MAELAASGPASTAIDGLRQLLAACALWQTLTGTANATDAKARTRVGAVRLDQTDAAAYDYPPTAPFAVFNLPKDDGGEGTQIGVGTLALSGKVEIVFYVPVSSGYAADESMALLEANNRAGTLLGQLRSLNGSAIDGGLRMYCSRITINKEPALVRIAGNTSPAVKCEAAEWRFLCSWGDE